MVKFVLIVGYVFILDRINPSTIFRTYGAGKTDWIFIFLHQIPPARNALARLPREILASGQACEADGEESDERQFAYGD
jgi:hypothetical protein